MQKYHCPQLLAEVFLERAGWVTVETVPPAGLAPMFEGAAVLPPPPAVPDPEVRPSEATDRGLNWAGLYGRLAGVLDLLPLGLLRAAGFALGGALLAAILLFRVPRRRYIALLERLGLRRSHYTDVGFFNDLMILLHGRGLCWAPGETAVEFLTRISAVIPAADAVFLADQYHRIRFGAAELADPARIAALMQALRNAPQEQA